MKKTVVVLAAALSLAGCASFPGSVDLSSSKTFSTICSSRASLHAAFLVVAATGKIKDSVVQKEAAAYIVVDSVCVNPPADLAQGVLLVATSYAIIVASGREAARVQIVSSQ